MSTSEKDREAARCEICGEPMPPGEQMFKYHGFSGPCPSGKVAEIPADTTHELVCRLEGILHVQGANQDWMHATRLVREAIATARAEGYRAGLERAAKECADRAVLNDAVEGGVLVWDVGCGVKATAEGHRAIEARECEHAIRALAEEDA